MINTQSNALRLHFCFLICLLMAGVLPATVSAEAVVDPNSEPLPKWIWGPDKAKDG